LESLGTLNPQTLNPLKPAMPNRNCYLAIALDDESLASLGKVASSVVASSELLGLPADTGFDAVDPSAMHMTFLFFGEHAGRLPAPALETLHERLCRELLDEGLSTPMAFKGFEIFGKMNVVVATFDAPQSMLDLRDRVLQACLKDPSFPPAFIKLLKEQVERIPHITLGKIRATRAQLSSVSCRRLRASLKAAQPKGLTMLGERPKRARLDWDAALEFLPLEEAGCE